LLYGIVEVPGIYLKRGLGENAQKTETVRVRVYVCLQPPRADLLEIDTSQGLQAVHDDRVAVVFPQEQGCSDLPGLYCWTAYHFDVFQC
jgi:hypothetical protein